MNIILYMAVTANGYIAKENDNTDFVSSIESESFCNKAREVGAIIVGRRTYEIMARDGDLEPLENIRVVVLSKKTKFTLKENNHSVASSPQEALMILKKEGFDQALVAGGATINALFMKDNLVNELFLDVEPIVFGCGIPLFAKSDFERKLQLLDIKKLSDNELQLRYKVLK